MSNCDVGSGRFRLPCKIIAEHGVEGCDHLSHDGNDNDFGFLVGRCETIVKDFEDGIISGCTEGGHVKDVADRHAATVDAAMSFEPATIEVVGRKADESSDLFAAHLAEFGQQRDEGEGKDRAYAPHRGQQVVTPREIGIAGDDLGHTFVEQKDVGLEPRQATFIEAPQHGILDVGGLVLDRDMLIAKLPPHGDDRSELLCGRIAVHDPCRHDRDILRDQPGIEAIVLGQDAAGAGELAKFVGVDASHRQARGQQGSDDAALVAATRFDAKRRNRQAAQPVDQLFPAGSGVIHRKALPLRQHLYVETILRYVDSTVAMIYHLRAPSLLMRVSALATVREWKKRLEHQAHSRFKSRGGCGLPVATGAVS